MIDAEKKKRQYTEVEVLVGVFDGRHTHALFPSGLRTLCLKEPKPNWLASDSAPTCRVCLRLTQLSAFFGSTSREWREELKARRKPRRR